MLDALGDLVHDVQLEPDFQKVAAMVVTRVTMILDCQVCSIYVRERKSKNLLLVENEGLNQAAAGEVLLPVGKGVVGLVAERTEPLNLRDMTRHPRFHFVEGLNEERFKVFLGSPISHHGNVLGVLVAQREDGAFSEDDEGFLASLATSLSTIVSQATAKGYVSGSGGAISRGAQRQFTGVAGSPGIGTGKAMVVQHTTTLEHVPTQTTDDVDAEFTLFETALAAVRTELEHINEQMSSQLDEDELALFEAYLHILDDDGWAGQVRREIRENSLTARSAVASVFLAHATQMEKARHSYLAERSQDLRDLGQRILGKMHSTDAAVAFYPENTILVAPEVTATMLGELPADRLKGIVSTGGSLNSHSAILARALNIPAVIGAANVPLLEIENAAVIVDGFYGEVFVNPSEDIRKHFHSLIEEEEAFAKELDDIRDLPSETPDGHRINLWVNIGLVTEITRSLDMGAEGIGLFRTEIPFANRDRFPTEEEQRQIYREHMTAFEPRPVTMRTLDIGGDKDLPYFRINEENPFLGWRGVRITLDHPDIFIVQVRAMLKANAGLECTLRIMLPMISNVEEVHLAKRLIDQCYREVRDEGIDVKRPEIGVMIEVPALIYQARLIAREVDFLAVGSNDLTQYMLAVSRTNPRVAELYQEFHPAVLRALRELAKAAHAERKGIGICGELAGTVEGAVLCIAMGYDVLSMNATNLLRVKWVIRNISLTGCRRILARVLRMDDAGDITDYIREQLQGIGLERVIPHHSAPEVFY